MNPLEILRHAHGAGLSVSLAASGNLFIRPPELLTPDLREMLVEHKPALVVFLHDAHATTRRLLDLAQRACDAHGDGPLARSQMQDDILATPVHMHADLLAHFEAQYPAPAASAKPVTSPPVLKAKAGAPPFNRGVSEAWREADRAYQAHHVNCRACQCAGQGRGEHCAPGAELWATYSAERLSASGAPYRALPQPAPNRRNARP